MRLSLRTLLVAVALVAVAGSGAAAAGPGDNLDISIVEDTRPRTPIAAGLSVAYTVTVTDKGTGAPVDRYVVFAHARNSAGEKTISYACGHTHDVDPRTPPGVYYCAVIVEHGGAWEFVAVVSDKRAVGSPIPVAQASVPFELASNQVVSDEVPGSELSASAWDVGVLFSHSAVAAVWFLCAGLLAALAVPRARQLFSPVGLHRLERRMDLLVKTTWAATGLVVGSGTYLTLNQTAYETPFTSSTMDAVFNLPYARPYFLALAVKVALYAVMILATFPLVRGAQRRLLVRDPAPASVDLPLLDPMDDPAPGPARRSGGVASAVHTELPAIVAAPPAPPVSRAPSVAAAVIAVGGVAIGLCVAILKYLHEIIETARGLL